MLRRWPRLAEKAGHLIVYARNAFVWHTTVILAPSELRAPSDVVLREAVPPHAVPHQLERAVMQSFCAAEQA